MAEATRGEPVVQIKTDVDGANPVALDGVRPLERGVWRIAEGAREIRGEKVEEIVLMARKLVAKVARLRGSQGMGHVGIYLDRDGRNALTIEAQWPIEKTQG